MLTVYYPAVFMQEDDGRYSVVFPDTGHATCGDDLQEALLMAEECLALSLEDDDVSPPSQPADIDLTAFAEDYEVSPDSLSLQHVKGYKAGKAKKCNITINEHIIQRVDDYASAIGSTRSAVLADAAKQMLENRVSS